VYPIVWFAIMAAVCVVYAERTNERLGPQARFFIHWPHATSLALAVVIVGFFVAERDFNTKKSVTVTSSVQEPEAATIATIPDFSPSSALFRGGEISRKKTAREKRMEKEARERAAAEKAAEEKKAKEKAAQVRARRQARMRAVIAFHAIGMTVAMYAGLFLWRREKWYPYVLAVVVICISCAYYALPDYHFLGNLVLVLVAVGFSLLGRITTRGGFIVAYALLVLFDMYSIWGSDIMSRISTNYPGVFPKFLTIDEFSGFARGIGAGDVLFEAIACNHIHQHCGLRRAAFFAIACTVGIVVGILTPSQTPLLIYVSPIAIGTLLVPKGWLRID
jgi:hypothetical protein